MKWDLPLSPFSLVFFNSWNKRKPAIKNIYVRKTYYCEDHINDASDWLSCVLRLSAIFQPCNGVEITPLKWHHHWSLYHNVMGNYTHISFFHNAKKSVSVKLKLMSVTRTFQFFDLVLTLIFFLFSMLNFLFWSETWLSK